MRVPLLEAFQDWYCPNCPQTDRTRPLPPGTSQYHNCRGLHGLSAPLIRAGVSCKVTAEERQDYLGSEIQARGEDGRQYMAVRTTTDDHDDLLVFAGLARAEMRT